MTGQLSGPLLRCQALKISTYPRYCRTLQGARDLDVYKAAHRIVQGTVKAVVRGRHRGCLVEQVTRADAQLGIAEQAAVLGDTVLGKGCKLSMDGRGAWRDNVFVERLWRSVKYERVYLKAYDSVSSARADIADYFRWYNTERPHSSLADGTPEETYLSLLPRLAEAA